MKHLLVIIALFAGCAVQMNVNGKTTYRSNNVLASITDPTPPPINAEIDSGFSPNPKTFENLDSFISENLRGFKNAQGCYGYISHRPSIVFDNKGLDNVQIWSRGGEVMYIEFEDGSWLCGKGKDPIIAVKDFPKGKAKVWVGSKYKPSKDKEVLTHHVTIEDYDRARDLGWSNLIDNRALDSAPKEPLVFEGEVPPVANLASVENKCKKHRYAEVPVQRFTLSRPVADLELVLTSPFAVSVELLGPIPENNRDIPVRCFKNGRNKIKRLEPGHYAIRVGSKDSSQSNRYHGMLVGPESLRDKMMIVRTMYAGLSIEKKALKYHTPFFDSHAMQTNRELAQSAFLTAPVGMMVFPKFDFDKVSAKPWSKTSSFPKKNEPLLVLYDRVVVTTDGLVYELFKYDYVTEERPETFIIPPNPRPPKDDRYKAQKKVLKSIQNRFDAL